MNDKQKQIEKMAEIIFNSRYKGNDYISPLKGANALYNAGYRKIVPNVDFIVRAGELTTIREKAYKDGQLQAVKEFAEKLFKKYSYDKLTHEDDEDIEIHLTASELDETLKEVIGEKE